MTDSEIVALLDAHDGLVTAYLEGTLSFEEFLLAYGEFPHSYKLVLRSPLRDRTAFHLEVARILSTFGSPCGSPFGAGAAPEGLEFRAGDFLVEAVVRRLRHLVATHPDFRVGTAMRSA